jgi:hypothetical protein
MIVWGSSSGPELASKEIPVPWPHPHNTLYFTLYPSRKMMVENWLAMVTPSGSLWLQQIYLLCSIFLQRCNVPDIWRQHNHLMFKSWTFWPSKMRPLVSQNIWYQLHGDTASQSRTDASFTTLQNDRTSISPCLLLWCFMRLDSHLLPVWNSTEDSESYTQRVKASQIIILWVIMSYRATSLFLSSSSGWQN